MITASLPNVAAGGFSSPQPRPPMDELHPGDRVRILDGPFLGSEATVEQVDQELGVAHLGLELVPGQPVTIVEPVGRLRRLDPAP
jgi:transcription antitermination factor NusG